MSLYIGLMSGTSCDGIDAALVDISTDGVRLIDALCLPYSAEQSQRLRQLAIAPQLPVDDIAEQDRLIAQLSVKAIKQLLAQSGYHPQQIRGLGCHGHTLRHRPQPDGFSWQIGDPSWIAEHSGICCVADFRRRDIAAGGQGAPLVPAFHQACLGKGEQARMVLNIGGIANLTVLGETIAGFDCGPGNALMDEWCQLNWQQAYDHSGKHASQGSVIDKLLNSWLAQPQIQQYVQQPPPKSCGRELFNLKYLTQLAGEYNYQLGEFNADDVMATLSQLSAEMIARAAKQFGHQQGEILLCGGGTHNPDLIARLQQRLPQHQLHSSEQAGIDPDWMEAMAFAWLAAQTLEHKAGNAPAVTGAKGERILGGIYPA